MTWQLFRWAVVVMFASVASRANGQYAGRGGPNVPQQGSSLRVGAFAPPLFPGPLPAGYFGPTGRIVTNYAGSFVPDRPVPIVGVTVAPPPPVFARSAPIELYIPPPRVETAEPVPPPPLSKPEPSLSPNDPPPPVPPMSASANGVAHFTVKLPSDAKLWVNDVETKPSGGSRRFHTPTNLETGRSYEYTFRAQWSENAQTVTRDRNVRFKPGEDLTVDFIQSPGR